MASSASDYEAAHLPVLLVHGLNARDWSLTTSPNWGRIPERLRAAGFEVFFSNHDSWYGIDHNARQIADAVFEVIRRTGAPQLHLVAHSKGGLDARRAVYLPRAAPLVATLTTLATPHKGLRYADILSHIPLIPRYIVAPFARAWALSTGDPDPHVMDILDDMTSRNLEKFDEKYPDLPDIEYRSYAFRAHRPNFHVQNPASMLLGVFDGRNDGVVPYWSTARPHRKMVHVVGKQKVTHDEPVDMHKRDIDLIVEDGSTFESAPEFLVALLEELDANARARWEERDLSRS